MKKMFFVPAALAATLLFMPSMLAQAAPTPSGAQAQRGQKMQKLAEELGLTDAQKAQMKTIADSLRKQATAVRDDTTLSVDAKRTKVEAIRKDIHKQMMAVLTPAQKEKLKQMRKMQQGAAK